MLRLNLGLCVALVALGCGGGDDDETRDAGAEPDGGAMRDGGGDGAGGDGGTRDAGADSGAVDASSADASTCDTDPAPPAQRCRSEADCTGNAGICVAEGDPPLCGICKPATRECEPDAQTPCGLGGVCIELTEACACGGPSSACVTDCRTVNPASACGANERCDQDTGVCKADCLSGAATCDAPSTCDPSDEAADANGCVRKACACDAECGDGACVKGLCRSELGRCTLPPP